MMLSETRGIRTRIGNVFTAISVVSFIDTFYSGQRQMEEAIYNSFDKEIWKSDSREVVRAKFLFAYSNIYEDVNNGYLIIGTPSELYPEKPKIATDYGGYKVSVYDRFYNKSILYNYHTPYIFSGSKNSSFSRSIYSNQLKQIGG